MPRIYYDIGLSNTALLDPNIGNDALGEVGNGIPFRTMQAAVNACYAAFNAAPANRRRGYVIQTAPFSQYDEDVTIDVTGGFHLEIMSTASWMLGDFQSIGLTNWRPTALSNRSLFIIGDASPGVDDIRPGVVLSTYSPRPFHGTTHEAYFGPRIAGRIDVSGITAGNLELVVEAELWGNGFADCINAAGNPVLSLYLHNTRFRKAANFGTNSNLFQMILARADALLSVGAYSMVDRTRIVAGFTVNGGLAGVPPQGFFNCDLDGTFTGPATPWIRLDLASNTTFVANGNGPIVGGGSKLLLNDATL